MHLESPLGHASNSAARHEPVHLLFKLLSFAVGIFVRPNSCSNF